MRKDEFDEVHVLGNDLQGSVLQDFCNSTLNSRAYSVYGHLIMQDGLSIGFTGAFFDSLCGHYVMGAGYRRYLPAIGRFYRPDDASPFNQGGLNAYAYVAGDPVNFTDLTGRWRSRRPQTFLTPVKETIAPVAYLGDTVDNQKYGRAILIGYTDQGHTLIKGHGDYVNATIGGHSVEEVLKLMQEEHLGIAPGPIHLFSCMGARKGVQQYFNNISVAQRLANITQQPVIAYKKVVYSNPVMDGNTYLGFTTDLERGKPKQKLIQPMPPAVSKKKRGIIKGIMYKIRGK